MIMLKLLIARKIREKSIFKIFDFPKIWKKFLKKISKKWCIFIRKEVKNVIR